MRVLAREVRYLVITPRGAGGGGAPPGAGGAPPGGVRRGDPDPDPNTNPNPNPNPNTNQGVRGVQRFPEMESLAKGLELPA